jgi:hypothetical protein
MSTSPKQQEQEAVISVKVIRPVMPLSHTSLRARDHGTSSTLIGGKGGAGPRSLYATLEGSTE